MSPAVPDPDRPVEHADAAHPPHPPADDPPATDRPTGTGEPTSADDPTGSDEPAGPVATEGPSGSGEPDRPVATEGPSASDGPGDSDGPVDPDGPPATDGLPVSDGPSGTDVRAALRRVAGVLVLLTVLGVPLGLLWAALAPGTPVIKTADGAVYAEAQPEQPIAADGWFSLLGLGFGVLVALGLWTLLRRHRGPLELLAGALGSLGAALVAWQLGRRIGLDTFQRLLVEAPVGRHFDKPADLRAGGIDQVLGVLPVPYGNLLLPAFAVAVTYTLLAGWSRWPSLRPEPVEVSWVPAGTPAPAAAPEPPAPDAAEPPRG